MSGDMNDEPIGYDAMGAPIYAHAVAAPTPMSNHDFAATCLCTRNHQPYPLEFNAHHIEPKEYGGPTTPENLVWLCPTAHVNVHELLRHMLKANRILSWPEVTDLYEPRVSRYAWVIAADGWRRIDARRAARPPGVGGP